MAKVRPGIVAFNGGEVGAKTLARSDLDNYPRLAEEMENVFPELQGGMSKAPGTKYIGTAQGAATLRPFEYASSANVVLEVTDASMRFIQSEAYLTLAGADATLGAWSDQSGAPSSGGGTAPGEDPADITRPDSPQWEISQEDIGSA